MKLRVAFALPLLLAAMPAYATGGFDCWTRDRSIVLTGSFGNSAGMPMDAAFLRVGNRTLSTAGPERQMDLAHGRIGEREISVDLVGPGNRPEARLRARLDGRGRWTGTLLRNGVSHSVRCEFEQM